MFWESTNSTTKNIIRIRVGIAKEATSGTYWAFICREEATPWVYWAFSCIRRRNQRAKKRLVKIREGVAKEARSGKYQVFSQREEAQSGTYWAFIYREEATSWVYRGCSCIRKRNQRAKNLVVRIRSIVGKEARSGKYRVFSQREKETPGKH